MGFSIGDNYVGYLGDTRSLDYGTSHSDILNPASTQKPLDRFLI